MNVSFEPVSVIVVNHNAGTLLLECVCSALEQAEQVIVVDNHSTDSSMGMLDTRFPGEPRLITTFVGKNLGFAAGCNIGMALAAQSRLLFLNPDCILYG